MNTDTFDFDINNIEAWNRRKQVMWGLLKGVFVSNESFQVVIKPLKKGKSYEQLKGYFRLINMILPVLKKHNPDHYFDQSVVDDVIKDSYGYFTEYKGVKSYKSKTEATIEDMIGLIGTAEAIGATLDIENCYLKSEEQQALEKFYENN